MIQTLTRSGHHRMILMGYGGVAFAVILTGIAGMGNLMGRERLVAAGFVYFHIDILLFLLISAVICSHSPPNRRPTGCSRLRNAKLTASGSEPWIASPSSGGALRRAVPLPLELRWFGWRGIPEAALSLMMVLLAYDWCFCSWNKLPFTCSHLPGKTPGWILAMQCFGVITLVAVLQTLILATLYSPPTSALCAVVAAWTRFHALRREGWTELRIKFDETPEPAVNGLNLLG